MRDDDAGPDGSELGDGLGPVRWYCVSRDGLATLCEDEADAHETVAGADKSWPLGGPHNAVRLVDAAALDAAVALAHDRYSELMLAVEWMLAEGGHMNQEHLARIRDAWERA